MGLPVRSTLVSRYVLSLHQRQRLTNGSLTQTFPNPASTTAHAASREPVRGDLKEWAYVAASRARDETRIYLAQSSLDHVS